ncbi:MAG: SBBP repeat-containing protein, partial [candidate division Zixibacteria bacterium]
MKNRCSIILAISFAIITIMGPISSTHANASPSDSRKAIGEMPLAFTENRGQWDEQAIFRADAGRATLWFTQEGVTCQFSRAIAQSDEVTNASPDSPGQGDILASQQMAEHRTESLVIKASFVGANTNARMTGNDQLEYKCHYLIGNDRTKWQTDVPNYSSISYESIYPGIDLVYYGNDDQMEYDFICSAEADISLIKIQYDGIESLAIDDDGALMIGTKWNTVREATPFVYQVENSGRRQLSGSYRLLGDNTFGFELGDDYDPSLPVIIDPLISYSTYVGGNGDDQAHGLVIDTAGNVFIVGFTASTDFPTTAQYQGSNAGNNDVFVTKMNSAGSGLIYSTYLGGSGNDYGYGIDVDYRGEVYVTGQTYSTNFPTENAYQSTHGLGSSDAFVTKLSETGKTLVFSTYLGGSSYDGATCITVNPSRNAFVAGFTGSFNFPMQSAYDNSYNGGLSDVFVTKLSFAGNVLAYSTFVGGSSSDGAAGIATDNPSNAWITGNTRSTNFPTKNPYQATHGGAGTDDAFITRLSVNGSVMLYSTFLGGSESDLGKAIAIDDGQ